MSRLGTTPLATFVRSIDRRTALVFLAAVTLAPTWMFFLQVRTLEEALGTGDPGAGLLRGLSPALLSFGTMLVLLVAVPAGLGRVLLGDRMGAYGVARGDKRTSLAATAFVAPLFALAAALGGALIPELRAEYPLSRTALISPWHFVAYEIAYLAYYAAWEFHFRGFLLLGAEKTIGTAAALGLSVTASVLMHLPKPAVEFYASIVAGLVLGWLALRTRSLIAPLLIHYAAGVANDLAIALGGAAPWAR
jgi:membrane protease YdiL (CAAX protease family)